MFERKIYNEILKRLSRRAESDSDIGKQNNTQR